MGHENNSYYFQGSEKHFNELKQELAHCGPWVKSGLLFVFINKVYWNTVIPIGLSIAQGCFYVVRAELTICGRECMTPKP